MAIRLYELAGADPERRFSPYCWRVRLALAHKGLPVETVPWRFTDKEAIAFSGQGKVPVLMDGDRTVVDSWVIATYLEETYPDRPSLFGGPAGMALSRFMNNWVDLAVLPAIFRMVVRDVWAHVDAGDQDYFRTTREQRLGTTLEAAVADREQRLPSFRQSLQPLRQTLETQPYVAGEAPGYADYAVVSAFQWARCISPFALLAEEDIVRAWRDRLLARFDGLARRTPAYEG